MFKKICILHHTQKYRIIEKIGKYVWLPAKGVSLLGPVPCESNETSKSREKAGWEKGFYFIQFVCIC